MQEYWDIYDINKNKTGRVMKRNDWSMKEGEYYISVLGVVRRSDGKFLITQRVLTKEWAAGWWEIPGGAVKAGESSLEAVIREVKEEVGLNVKPESIKEFGYVHRIQRGKHEPVFIQDNFYYLCDVENNQELPQYSDAEKREEFVPVFVDLIEAIRVNEEFVKANPSDLMIERELRVLRMVQERIVEHKNDAVWNANVN